MLYVNFVTLLCALEVNIDLRHANHIRYYYIIITSLYISFTFTNSDPSLETRTTTFIDILCRMNLNKLLLNPSTAEILLIGTKQQRLTFSDLTSLSLSNDSIPVSFSSRKYCPYIRIGHVFL